MHTSGIDIEFTLSDNHSSLTHEEVFAKLRSALEEVNLNDGSDCRVGYSDEGESVYLISFPPTENVKSQFDSLSRFATYLMDSGLMKSS